MLTSITANDQQGLTYTFEGRQLGGFVRGRHRAIAAAQTDISSSIGIVEIATMWTNRPPRTSRLCGCNAAGRTCYGCGADVWCCRCCHLCDI